MKKFFSFFFIIASFHALGQQVTHNFESGSIDSWYQQPAQRWSASSEQPISGTYSLRHTSNVSVASIDTVCTTAPNWDVTAGKTKWNFMLKHGYDPSSSNNWGFWLMADSILNNGYVVGVNFTNSDDLVKLWKVSNGIASVLITSSVNWQTSIKKTGIGAISVERLANGTFKLLVDTTGTFDNLVNEGTAFSPDVTTFKRIGVRYKYSSSAKNLLWIDNISILYEPINQNDVTTSIVAPVAQVASSSISSLANTVAQAVEVMRFAICDSASGDNLPTKVKRVVINNQTSASWSQVIGGAFISKWDNTILSNSAQISNTAISFEIEPNLLVIEDGEKRELSLSVYLKHQGITDNELLRFGIDKSHGFMSDVQFSGFVDELSQPILSNNFSTNVVATKLTFKNQPASVSTNAPFQITVAACDAHGNIDTDYNGNIQIALNSGNGELTSDNSLSMNATNGIAQFTGLHYSTLNAFSLIATSSLGETTSSTIIVTLDANTNLDVEVEQPLSLNIPSTSVTPESAKNIMRLRITDVGDDNSATEIKSIKFNRPSTSYTALNKIIGGILIGCNGFLVPIAETNISSGSVEIVFAKGSLSVPNGTSLDVLLKVFLKSSSLIDGDSLKLLVPVTHEFTTYSTGSSFETTFEGELCSSTFYIDVEATMLSFIDAPGRVGLNSPFSTTIGATDLYKNIDSDFSGSITLCKNLGDGQLVFPAQNISFAQNGQVSFSELTYNKTGVFNLLAKNSLFTDAVSANITCGDADATIISTVNEIDTLVISSNLNNPESAIEVMRFRFVDKGSTDNLPTIPTQIALNTFNPNSATELSRLIGGFVIETSDGKIIHATHSVSSGKILVSIPEYELIIGNSDSLDVTLKLYLNPKSATDGFTFRFYIPATSHGLETSANGTIFNSNLTSSIYGKPCRINVEATKIVFASYPFIINSNEQFTVVALATDNSGNIDFDYSGLAQLQKYSGRGNLVSATTNVPIENGVAQFQNLSFDAIDEYSLIVSGDNLQSEVSQAIVVGYNLQPIIDEDFESTLPTWNGISNWEISQANAISGLQSLIHAGNSNYTQSFLSNELNLSHQGKALEWQATFRNGNWDPTSSSYFYMVLAATSDDYSSPECSGLAMGINPSAGNDFISLWHFNGSKRTTLISSDFDWNENDEVTVRATYRPNGQISLWFCPKNSQLMTFAGSAEAGNILASNFCGFAYGYTESRIGQLWIDNVKISSIGYPPRIESAKAQSLSKIKVMFSKCVNSNEAQNVNSYNLVSSNNGNINITEATLSDNCHEVLLRTEKLPITQFTLFIDSISDESAIYIADSIDFGFSDSHFGRLVINEIMANPTNAAGLPEIEYIELYNPTSDTVNIDGWKLFQKNSSIRLPEAMIAPNTYAVLTSASGSTFLAQYGQSIGVSSFPSLTNDGMLIKLIDNQGQLISFVSYNKAWYGSSDFENGGYSLERIDPQNPAEGSGNWSASKATAGGTPCAINSIFASNPDLNAPSVQVEVVDSLTLHLKFSEPMDSLNMSYTNNYQIDNGIGFPITATIVGQTYDEVTILLASEIEIGVVYSLSIDESVADFAGNSLQNSSIDFIRPYTPAEGDIAINEILFNPYNGGVDFVEVYNRSEKAFNLAEIYLANRSTEGEVSSVCAVTDSLMLLEPHCYAVITTNPTLVEEFYYVQNPNAFAQASKMPSYSSSKGCVIVLNSNGQIVDEFFYNEKMHNKLLNDTKGISLERVNFDEETNSALNWQSAAQTVGFATPTYQNSQFSEFERPEGAFDLSPETFSPDGDGFDDYLAISYSLPEPGCLANIRVYNASGIEVCRLANNAILGTEGSFRWDGQNSNNKQVPVGIYIINIEYFNLNGNLTREKLVCVVAKK